LLSAVIGRRGVMHAYRKVASQVEVLTNTRLSLVLFPKCCLVRSGTPRSATLVGKCVLLTEGPATNGPFTDEALTAPAEDLTALAEVIDRAWGNSELRERRAAAGYGYAFELGGEPELVRRLVDAVVAWVRSRR